MEEKKIPASKFWTSLKGKIILVTAIAGGLAAFLGNIKTISESISNLFSPKVAINPLSFTYYNLKGRTIDYLLEGKIDSSWEVKLSKHPYIITNEVFNVLNDLRKKFNYPNEREDIMPEVYLKKNDRENTIKVNKTLTHHMVGTYDYTEEISDRMSYDGGFIIEENDVSLFVNEELKKKLKESKSIDNMYKWFLSRSQLLALKRSNLLALKRLTGDDFPDNWNKLINFLIDITKDYYPDRFIEAKIYCELLEGCGDTDELIDTTYRWCIDITPPSLSLKVVLIENASSQTLSIGKFYIKENKDFILKKDTTYSDSTEKLSAYNYFPKEKLKPNETIVLPQRIILKTVLKEQFTFGPVQLLESIEINNDNYAVREESTENILIYDGVVELGSCPYVYTFSKNENIWLLENHILYGYNSKEKEKEHILPLNRFNGQIQIRENDPETSYIDYLYIKHVLPDGTIKMLKPNNTSLSKKDGNYLVLNKGDKMLLDFPKEDNVNGTYSVISYGYYLRYKKMNVTKSLKHSLKRKS